jgi:hypothetical protein
VEPAVYGKLPHPTLLIYPLDPNWKVVPIADTEQAKQAAAEETAKAEAAWGASAQGEADVLMALKIAIPGEPGAKSGDVVYLLNGPAIEEFHQDFKLSEEDEEDLDE